MKFITLVAALAAAIPAAFGLTINTPTNVVTCEPTQLNWSGGTAPYYLTLVPAGQPAAPAIQQFPTQNGTSYTWTVNILSGTSFNIALKDSTGATAYSDIVTVQAGTSTSCVSASVSGGSSPASTGGSGSSVAGSTATAGTTAKASAGSSATSSASGSTSTPTSAAGRLSVSSALGVAGIMGLVGAALF